MKFKSIFLIYLIELNLIINFINCELGCKDLPQLVSFKSTLQFLANLNNDLTSITYIEETKENEYGKLLIQDGNGLQKIYYQENTQTKKFIGFEMNLNECKEYNYDKDVFHPKIGNYMFVYDQNKKTFIGPSGIYMFLYTNIKEWQTSKGKKREIDCLICKAHLAENFLDIKEAEITLSLKEKNNILEPIRIEIAGKKDKDSVSYVIDYFEFTNITNFPSFTMNSVSSHFEEVGKFDRNYRDYVLDIPSIGCPKANFLSNFKFSLYLPNILKLQFKKPKINDTQTEELLDIVYDKVNKLIRVDNGDEKYYEIADLSDPVQKKFYYFINSQQCVPFYELNFSEDLKKAISFIDSINDYAQKDFYHVGQKLLEGNIVAEVFELSKTENRNKDVTTLYTREIKSLSKDNEDKKPKLSLFKIVNTAYELTDKDIFDRKYEIVYNIHDYSERFYDEDYRLFFNLLPCTLNFRDRAYISFEADFDKEKNPDKEQLSLERLKKEEENVKNQLTKLIEDSHSITILSIQYVQYYVSNQKLKIQLEFINTGTYTDSFNEYEDNEDKFTKNLVTGTFNECAFRSYDQQTFYGFRYCSFKDRTQSGNCYLVDDNSIFKKTKKNPKLFNHKSIKLTNKIEKSFYKEATKLNQNFKNILNDDQPNDDKTPICVLMKKNSDKLKLPIIPILDKIILDAKANKFKLTFKKESKKDSKSIDDNSNDDKKNDLLTLNLNLVYIYPNDKLFPLEKISTEFDLISAGKQIKPTYRINLPFKNDKPINSANDCYLNCLNTSTDKIVCHSFGYCFDVAKSVSTCQYSNLHFDSSLEDIKLKNKPIDENSSIEKYSKWLEKSTECSVFNLEFKNYFNLKSDQTIKDTTDKIEEDLTLEQCLGHCYKNTKKNIAEKDNNLSCRSVEYCIEDEKQNDSELRKKSFCKISNMEVKYLPKKDFGDEKTKNCKLYAWNYLNDYNRVDSYKFKKVTTQSRLITEELCAKRCSIEPYCKGYEFCYLSNNNERNDISLLGNCVYESDEEDYTPTSINENMKCNYQAKIKDTSLLLYSDITLPETSNVTNFRKKIVKIRNKDEVLSKTFWSLNISLFISSMVLVFILIISFKKFYNRYKNDPNQSYTSFFNRRK